MYVGWGECLYYGGGLGILGCGEEKDSITVETKDMKKMVRVSKEIEKESK